MGFKEDILVLAYTGQTEYSFTLQTGGLTAVNQSGTWVLVDEDNTVCASLSDVIVFTADERNNTFGELRVEEITAGQTYRLTVVLDADWLADPKTVYPITIDPSVDYANTAGNIEDLVVGTSTTYSGTSGSLYVGRGASGAKIRTLMRFPNLRPYILGYQITSAYVSIRDLICQTTSQEVECYQYTGDSWEESDSIEWTEMGETPLGIKFETHSVVYGGGNKSISGNAHRYAFDITALAQMWASGTADPADGVIFKATDDYEVNGTKTFKTFASINRGSNPPTLTINYTPTVSITASSTTINEGSTLSLSASVYPSDTTVTWSTSNSSIATVSSTGLVTGIHAGSVTITATAADGDSDTISLIVTIPDGVYHITNNYSNLYLATELSCAPQISVTQRGLFTSTPSSTRIMWRVHHVGNGLYTIRPMSKLSYGLTYLSAYGVHTSFLGPYDTLGSTTAAQWKIIYDGTGYLITYQGYSYQTLALESDTIAIGANVVIGSQSSNLTRQRWSFSAITTEYTGAILYNTDTYGSASTATKRYVSVGKSRGIDELAIEAAVYSSTSIIQNVYWISSDPTIAAVDSASGRVTGVSPGTVTITAYKANESGTGGIGTPDSYTVVIPDLPDGTYYIRNRQHGKYIQADDATAPTYTQAGVALEQWEFDGGTHQRWVIELSYDGYYRIQSDRSGLYMATQLGGEGTEDLFILQENYVDTPRQLWKIELTSNGSYKIKAKSSLSYATDLAMVAANIVNGSSNGIQVQQRLYMDNDSYKDEWFMCPIGSDAFLLGITDEGHDHSSYMEEIRLGLVNNNYDINDVATHKISANDVIQYMEECRIFVSRSHGNKDADGTYILLSVDRTTYLHANMLYDFDSNRALANLNNCEVMLFIACLTGANEDTSLPDAAVLAGADAAVGFQEKINCWIANYWTQYFFEYYLDGDSVSNSCQKAARDCHDWGNVNSYVVERN